MADRSAWDPHQYLRFAGHRLRPAIDLLNQIDLSSPKTVVDLGCGAGNVAVLLRDRWPEASVVGVDGSADMLAKAREIEPEIDWIEADMAAWTPATPPDLIYSNAALHWLGDHAALFPRLIESLAPGGVLAVQMPRNFGAPSHTAMADAALDGPWRETLEPLLKPAPVAEPAFYYGLLASRAAALDVWETEYLQVLEGDDPVAEWTKGTWLRPLLDALDEPARSGFEAAYRGRVRAAYPRRADGRTLFPFRRLFLVARRSA
jgi:trans-aconitate 2-methyltransferase